MITCSLALTANRNFAFHLLHLVLLQYRSRCCSRNAFSLLYCLHIIFCLEKSHRLGSERKSEIQMVIFQSLFIDGCKINIISVYVWSVRGRFENREDWIHS